MDMLALAELAYDIPILMSDNPFPDGFLNSSLLWSRDFYTTYNALYDLAIY